MGNVVSQDGSEWRSFKQRLAVLVYALAQVCPKGYVSQTLIRKFALFLSIEGKFDFLPKVLNHHGPDPPELADAVDELAKDGVIRCRVVEVGIHESDERQWHNRLLNHPGRTKQLHIVEVTPEHFDDVIRWARTDGLSLERLIRDCREVVARYRLSLDSVAQISEVWRRLLLGKMDLDENYRYWSIRWLDEKDKHDQVALQGVDTIGAGDFKLPIVCFRFEQRPLSLLKQLAKTFIIKKETAPVYAYRIRSIRSSSDDLNGIKVLLIGHLRQHGSSLTGAKVLCVTLDQCEHRVSPWDQIEVWLDQEGHFEGQLNDLNDLEVAVLGHISATATKDRIIKAYAIIRIGDTPAGTKTRSQGTLDSFL